MTSDNLLRSEQFPRASRYNPDWVLASVSGAANPLWMTEWLAEALNLKPGMRAPLTGSTMTSESNARPSDLASPWQIAATCEEKAQGMKARQPLFDA